MYLIRQAKGQLTIIYNTVAVQDVLLSNDLTDHQKSKIRLIHEIKAFAEKQIGLNKTTNYTTFYNQHGKPVLWMLTACEPFAFKEKLWHFPLLGDVSYKGFFAYESALKEASALKLQHYDVDLGKVSAWSTLGILSDPILSSMLEDDEGELAELIIHELTHATLYIPNNVDFNENFASFTGRQGAIQFLTQQFGAQSQQMEVYLKDIKDEETLKSFLLAKKDELELFYNQLNPQLTAHEKAQLKQHKMEKIIREMYLLDMYNWNTKIKIAFKIKHSGNAFFMSYHRYDAQYDEFLNTFKKCSSNLRNFISFTRKEKSH